MRKIIQKSVFCIILFSSLAHADDSPSLKQLSLKEAEQLLLVNNHEIQVAKRYIDSADADTLIAGQKPNPTLSVNANNFKTNFDNGRGGLADKTIDSIVRIDQLIERGNKRELRIAASKSALEATQFDYKDTVRQQTLLLRTTFFDLLLNQEKEKFLINNQALYEKYLAAAELRLAAGDIADTDVVRIRVDALRSKNDLRQVQADKEKSQSNLAYLIGKESEAKTIVVDESWPVITAIADNNLENTLIDGRPDILAAESRKKLAEENRQLADSLKTRDVTVGVQYEHFPIDSRNTIGAGFSIPLFTNYQYQGEIAKAEASYTTALEAEQQTHALAFNELAKAQADLQSSIEKLQRYDDQMLSQARKAAQAAEFAYQHGAMDVTDLLDARRVLKAIELETVTARADYAKSLAAWQAATNNIEEKQ